MKRYWKFIIPAGIVVAVLAVLIVSLNASLVYFNTPTELAELDAGDDRLRLGGQVVPGSVADGTTGVTFEVTDGREAVMVVYTGRCCCGLCCGWACCCRQSSCCSSSCCLNRS